MSDVGSPRGISAVSTSAAPAAVGPYSQASIAGDFVFCSGQIALDPSSGKLVTGGTPAEAERVIANLAAVLQAAGAGLEDVVKTTIYLLDMADFASVNEVYGRFFREPFPARATVAVAALPRGARIEIDAIARLPR